MITLDEIKELKSTKENEIIEFCKSTDKKIVVMPAGQKTMNFTEYLKGHNIDVTYFVDNNKDKHGTFVNDIKILSFDDLLKIKSDVSVIICTNSTAEKELGEQLECNGISDYKKTSVDYICYNQDEIDNPDKILEKNYEEYKKLYSMLEDDFSQNTLDNRLKFMLSNQKKYIEEIALPPESQYFADDVYKVNENDVIVDCGAYTGDTLEIFLKKTNNKTAGYYAFEPDDKNFEKLKQVAANADNVFPIKKGAYSKSTTLYFSGTNNSIAKIEATGENKIEVAAIDEELNDKKITFLKMDIEGAEMDALLGAKKTIREQKPALAICVYHKFNDIFDIPNLIQSFGVDYKYYLRHYTENTCETVFYAVSK